MSDFVSITANPSYVRFSKNGFDIVSVWTTEGDKLPEEVRAKTGKGGKYYFTVKGNDLPTNTAVRVEYTGSWKTDKYGTALQVTAYDARPVDNKKSLVSFFSSNQFPGIGKKLASNLVDTFGVANVIHVIENEPERILNEVPGMTEKRYNSLISHYNEKRTLMKLNLFLKGFGLTTNQIDQINKAYGVDAIEKIRKNPYDLQFVQGISFLTADKVALGLKVALDSLDRIEGAVVYTLRQIKASGHMYGIYSDVKQNAMKLLNSDGHHVDNERFTEGVKFANKHGVIKCYKTQAGNTCVMLKTSDDEEQLAANDLAQLLTNTDVRNMDDKIQACIDDFNAMREHPLSQKQQEAVLKSLTHHASVITGGAGTGKTTIMSCIMYAYERLHPGKPITLLAPTGKAARRMKESTGTDAHTIHSQLHIFEGSEGVQQLPDGLIIVDEFSMVDQNLCQKLFSAVPSKRSNLIMVGDVNQLPSVGAGQCLSEMISSHVVPVNRLTETFRQSEGSVIVTNSLKVNEGKTDLEFNDAFQLRTCKGEEDALEQMKSIYIEEVKKYGIEEVVILCPRRKAGNDSMKVVSNELNAYLQDMINPKTDNTVSAVVKGTEYRKGDRVMQWKNRKTSSNGDIGTLIDIENDDLDGLKFTIQFDGWEATYNEEEMEDFSLAYSMTIHKSQGSEYKSVIIPLLEDQKCQLFRRNLLYTAITRAKEKVIILTSDKPGVDIRSERSTLSQTILTCDTNQRKSFFSNRIRGAVKAIRG